MTDLNTGTNHKEGGTGMKRIFTYVVLGLLVSASPGWSAETVLRTCYQLDCAPRYFEEGNFVAGKSDRGICIDLINALNEKLARHNTRIMFTEHYTLPQINAMMERNELDLFVGLMKTPEREKKLVFSSVPLFDVHGQFAKRVHDPFEYTGAMSVRGKTVGVQRGAEINRLIAQMREVRTVEASTIGESLQMLRERKVDLVFHHDLGLGWAIRKGGFAGEVVLADKPMTADSQYIVFTRQVPMEVKVDIANALLELQREGTMDKILKAYEQ